MPKGEGYPGQPKTGAERGRRPANATNRTKGRSDGTGGGWYGPADRLQVDRSSRRRTPAGGIGAEPVDSVSLSAFDRTAEITSVNGEPGGSQSGPGRIGAMEIEGLPSPLEETRNTRGRGRRSRTGA
jgi:hypothetical protein